MYTRRTFISRSAGVVGGLTIISSVPILAINTDVSVSSRGRYTLTELDQRTLMKPLTKWNAVLDRSADIPRTFRKAFEAMTSGRPGAAHIALPFDVQSGPVERSDVWADPTLGSFPSRRVAPDPAMVELAARLRAAGILSRADGRPVDDPGAVVADRRREQRRALAPAVVGSGQDMARADGGRFDGPWSQRL